MPLKRALTPEGQKMWNNLKEMEAHIRGKAKPPLEPPPPEKPNPYKVEIDFMRDELRRMIKNSQLVITDCDNMMAKFKTYEEYMASEAKVAKFMHTNLIERLQRILDGLPAFNHKIELDEETDPNELRNPFSNVPL
jgi:hypothetical protein